MKVWVATAEVATHSRGGDEAPNILAGVGATKLAAQASLRARLAAEADGEDLNGFIEENVGFGEVTEQEVWK